MQEQYSSPIQTMSKQQKRPQTAILMKQFRVAGQRPKTPLESLNILPKRVQTCKVFNSFVGKKLSAQQEEYKMKMRNGSRSSNEREVVLNNGRRLDPYEFINQKYHEIMKEQEEELRLQTQLQQQSPFADLELIKDQLNSPNTLYLTQNIENSQSRPQSGVVRINSAVSNSQKIQQHKTKATSNTSLDQQPSLIINKVVDVRRMEENAYYSPRDKAIKEILNSNKANTQRNNGASTKTLEVFSQYAQDYFLINPQNAVASEKRNASANQDAKASFKNVNKQASPQPQLFEFVANLNHQQQINNNNGSIDSPIILKKQGSLEQKLNQSLNASKLENTQTVFSQLPNSSFNQSYMHEEQNSINSVHQPIQHRSLKGHPRQIKNQSFFNRQVKVLPQKQKYIPQSPDPYQNCSTSRSNLPSTAQKDTSRSRGIHQLTTNETIKTEEDTPSKSVRTHYFNDFIKSPYQPEVL